jgi:hemoglobin-like flavoprotein
MDIVARWHDALRWLSDPWIWVGLLLIGFGLAMLVVGRIQYGIVRRRQMRWLNRKEDEPVSDDRARAADTISAARNDTESGPASTTAIPAGLLSTEQNAPATVTQTEPEGDYFFGDPVSDSGVHALPDLPAQAWESESGHRVACAQCEGKGYIVKSTRDLLLEVAGLIGDGGDEIVREFYVRLLTAAPYLAELFPPDLTGKDEIKGQRDKLLGAIKALLTTYDPDDPDGLDRLDTALQAMGRSHAAFYRPSEGVTRGATWEEYGAVKSTATGTIADAAGDAFTPAHEAVVGEAFDYAAGEMIREQHRTGMRFPRQPRQ